MPPSADTGRRDQLRLLRRPRRFGFVRRRRARGLPGRRAARRSPNGCRRTRRARSRCWSAPRPARSMPRRSRPAAGSFSRGRGGRSSSVWSNFRVDQVVRTDAGADAAAPACTGCCRCCPAAGCCSPPRSLLDTSPLRELLQQVDPARADSGQHRRRAGAGAGSRDDQLHDRAGRRVLRRHAPTVARLAARAPRRRAPDDRPRRADGQRRDPVHLPGARASTATITATAPCASSRRSVRPCTSAPTACWSSARARDAGGDAGRRRHAQTPPSPGHLLGFVLDSLFTDGLSIDLERLRQINRPDRRRAAGPDPGRRPIEVLVIQPSDDPTAIARRHLRAMPRSLRTLLRDDRRARGARRAAGELPAVRGAVHPGTDGARAAPTRRPAREIEAFLD